MRTAIRIDDGVLIAVQERAKRERRTAGEVLSELARQALNTRGASDAAARTSHYGFRPLPRRGPVISNELIDRLREEEPL